MKKILFAGLAFLTLAFASCRKDESVEAPVQTTDGLEVSGGSDVFVSAWMAPATWKSTGTADEATLSSEGLSEDISKNGVVLVYGQSAGSIELLPYTDAAGVYWYYQVSGNAVTVYAQKGEKTSVASGSSFRIVALSERKVGDIETAGTVKADLIGLSHDKLSSLIQ